MMVIFHQRFPFTNFLKYVELGKCPKVCLVQISCSIGLHSHRISTDNELVEINTVCLVQCTRQTVFISTSLYSQWKFCVNANICSTTEQAFTFAICVCYTMVCVYMGLKCHVRM